EISDDYRKAIPSLTISEKRETMQAQSYQELQDLRTQLEQYKRTTESQEDDIKSMREDMKNVFEVLRVVKRNGGEVGPHKHWLDENRNITFYQDYENAYGLHETVGVKIPIDEVEVEEFQSTRP